MSWKIEKSEDLDVHRPVRLGGFRVLLMIALTVGGALLAVKSGLIYGLSESTSPYAILALVCYFGALRFIARGSVHRFLRNWWQRNVVGRVAVFGDHAGEQRVVVVSQRLLGMLGDQMLAIPLGGWRQQSVVSVPGIMPGRWKLRFTFNRTRKIHPDCIDMIDRDGNRIVVTDAWEVLALLNSVGDVYCWWKVVEKIRNRLCFQHDLMISILEGIAERILAGSRLKDMIEGHQVLRHVAAELEQRLPPNDKRRERYERIAHEPDPLPRPRRARPPATPPEETES